MRTSQTYHVFLHGRGLQLLDDLGARKPGGVYVWRTVTAEDESSAVSEACRRVLLDPPFLEDVLNESLDEIEFEAEEILIKDPDFDGDDSGYVFYVGDEEDLPEGQELHTGSKQR